MEFLGRLHPLLVHLPIGILLLAFGLECLARFRRRPQLRPAIRLSLGIGAVVALCTAGSGWLLAQQGGYDETLLQRHQWAGLATAALAVVVWGGYYQRWYFPVFALTTVALATAGHFGGSLTHGATYLFERRMDVKDVPGQAVLSDQTPIFAGLIQPILKVKCLSCHNAAKRKGELRLDTPEFMLHGGKHGAVLIPGQPDSSNLLRRARLPLIHDDHMPPSGKPQLTDTEIRLLSWWIAQGADFQATLAQKPLPADLAEQMAPQQNMPANPVFALKVAPASNSALEKLRSLLINANQVAEHQPWLMVSLAGQRNLTSAHWTALRGVGDQTVELDLAHTDADDTQLTALTDFPHLLRLNLANTRVTDQSAAVLAKLTYLESLNLTGTGTGDGMLSAITWMQHLRRLFLWQTKVTPGAVAALRQKLPGLQVETGAILTDTTRMALRAPKALYGRSFFDDTLHVALDFPFRGVELYYTLDEAASPTTQSSRYREPIVLQNTAHLRAFAAKEGWSNSPIVEAVLVKKRYTPVQVYIEKPPSPKYPAKGAASLIDGKIGAEQGADTWLGYEGEHLKATLDLGKPLSVQRVYVHCLENNSPWIFKPAAIQVLTSDDGKKFVSAGEVKFVQNTAMGELKIHLLACDLTKPMTARYVRVEVMSLLKNPPWHPGKGQKCWIFVDEIVVE